MKKMLMFLFSLVAVSAMASCDEKLTIYEDLPQSVKSFITTYFPDATVTHSYQDDDLINPDYEVILSNGTQLEFSKSGDLKKVSSRSGIPTAFIPESILNYVEHHYPGVGYTEYEVGKRTYEVSLTNGLELKFNSNFAIVEIDD